MSAFVTEFISSIGITDLLRVVWMEIALASVAATVYFTLTGWITLPGKGAGKAKIRKGSQKTFEKVTSHEPSPSQLVAKALRQGNINSAVALLLDMPETMSGYIPANLAPRLLLAAAKADSFDKVMSELNVFIGKIEARSLEAAVGEAAKSKDRGACRQLHVMSRMLSIPKSQHTLEAFAKAFASDADCLRMLLEETEAPLARPFAKAMLEACTVLKDIDLAAEVFEKVADTDAAMLRNVVEKAATTKGGALSDGFVKEIRTCAKNGNLEGAVNIFEEQRTNTITSLLYNSIIDACVECGDLEKAVDYFNQAHDCGMVDVVSYNMVMKGFLSKNQVSKARSLMEELKVKGLAPTIATYHGFMNFHATAQDSDSAWKVVDEMQAVGIAPSAVTCSILLKGKLSTPGDLKKVLKLVDTIDPMDEVLFSTLADACIRTGQLDILTKYQAKLPCQGSSLVLSAPTYGSMIKAYGQMYDVKRVWDLWNEMVKNNIVPTAITLGCMIEALVANHCTADAWTLLSKMRNDADTRPLVNTVIYSTVLKGFANAKETSKVMALYEEMKSEGIQPNNITYNTVLNAFAQGGAMDRVPALLEDMKAATPPAEPDIVTYSTIVKGYCNSGGLDRALEIVKDMQSDGKLSPDEVMYNSVLDGCAKEHRPNEALKLLDDMKRAGVSPSNYTLSIMVKLMGRCRRLNQAFSIVDEMSRDYGLKVNIQVYTCLIQACFNNRQANKAVSLHDQMIKEGLVPDEMTYSALVSGCIKANLVDKAVHIAKCGHGLASPKARGNPPGINSRCLEELLSNLDVAQGNALRTEFAQSNAGSQKGKGKGKGGGKGGGANSAPWRQRA